MSRSIFIAATAIALTGTFGSVAQADSPSVAQEAQTARSTFLGHRVLSIAPHWVDVFGKEHTGYLAGADIRIEAEPGLTAEYLTVEVRREVAASAGHPTPNSVLGVARSNIEVRSTGDGFVVRITAKDTKSAQEIVRRARLMG